MHDISLESRPPGELLEEIARLRSELARLEARIEDLDRLAHLDTLVPLSNRRGMLRDLDRMIARFDRYNTPAALLFVDLDDLKTLNDCFGHSGGDAALIHVAEQLLAGTRANDCVARLGGDEFCVVLERGGLLHAQAVADRVAQIIARGENQRSVSCGIAIADPSVETPSQLLRAADVAQYEQKRSRRGGGRFAAEAAGQRRRARRDAIS